MCGAPESAGWIQASKSQGRFRPVHVVTSERAHVVANVVVRLTADGPRVEGLDVEAAARLLALLR